MKKHISILLIFTFLISVLSVGNVFAYEAETTVDDTFVENVILEDYVTTATSDKCDIEIDGNAMTFTPHKTTGTTNNQYGDNIDGYSWNNSGRVEVYYTVSYEGELVSGDAYGMGIGLTAFDGTSRAWILGGVQSYAGFKFESGVTKNIKHVVDFTDSQTIVNSYVKSLDDEEWTYAFTVTNNFAAAPNKRHLRELLVFSQHNFNKGTENVSTTISDVKVVEPIISPLMTEVGGNYLAIDEVDVSYYIPSGYKSATLTFNGEVLKEFTVESDGYGSFNTRFGLSQFGVIEENLPLKLEVTMTDDSVLEATELINVTEPILEPSFEDVSGVYTTAKTLNVNFELPHVYTTAKLTYNDVVVAEYNSSENGGGPYSVEISLGDYEFVGENFPLTLSVSYDEGEDDIFTSLITVTESYPNAELTAVGGLYLIYDSITANYILPDDYISAKLTYNGEVVREHNAETESPGRYSQDISFADFEVTGKDIPLTLTVDIDGVGKKEFTSEFEILKIMSVNEILTEDFEDESYTMTNDVNADFTPEQINSTSFSSKVYQHEFTTTSFARSQIIKSGLAVEPGVCLDVSWDFNVSNARFIGGLHGKKTSSVWYSSQRFIKDGKVLDKAEYETDKWYSVLYRILPGSVTESGKHEIHLYLDGRYIGSTETVYTDGFYQLAIDYENGYSLGKMYIDNIKMVSYSPMFDVIAGGGDGADEVDADAPYVKVQFDQKMAKDSINSDNIKLIGFNGAEVSCTLSYDENTYMLTIIPTGKLVPGKEYKLYLSPEVASAYGAYWDEGYEASIKTKEAPFVIESVSVPALSAGDEFDTTVKLSNSSGTGKTAKVFVALFKDEKLECITSCDASGEYTQKELDLTLKAPTNLNGDVKVCTYLVSGTNSFSVIDWVEQ